MIQQMSFLGIPLRTQLQRRMLVVGYYMFVALFAGLGVWRGHGGLPGFLFPQIIVLGSMLGGLTVGRPVKPYSSGVVPDAYDSPISLNQSGRKVFSPYGPQLLDEREQSQRDHAHFVAYRILLVSLVAALIAYCSLYALNAAWTSLRASMLLWTIVVYAISLPQSVLLWTEPPMPVADVIPMHGV